MNEDFDVYTFTALELQEMVLELITRCEEQARLLGMSGEREARLLAKIERLKQRYKFIVVSKGEIPLGYLEKDPEGDLAADTAEEIERLELIIQQYKEDSKAMNDNYTEALAEIKRLKTLASDLNDDNIELRQTLMMENAELKEKIERLKAALHPFAVSADAYEPRENDDNEPAFSECFTLGDLRRAKDAVTDD